MKLTRNYWMYFLHIHSNGAHSRLFSLGQPPWRWLLWMFWQFLSDYLAIKGFYRNGFLWQDIISLRWIWLHAIWHSSKYHSNHHTFTHIHIHRHKSNSRRCLFQSECFQWVVNENTPHVDNCNMGSLVECNCDSSSLKFLSAWQQGTTQPYSRSEPKTCI